MTIKLLMGGSPCTAWSIAQKNNRETEPSGMGWELFKNYLIAKEKFQPDFFLYENNKSAAQAIKDQISHELGVPLQHINSALVSAQNRQRFYAHNLPNVPQPEDRGILLKDILESGANWQNKSYALTTRCQGAIPEDTIKRHRHTMVAESVPFGENKNGKAYCLDANYFKGMDADKVLDYKQRTMAAEPVIYQKPRGFNKGGMKYDKSPTITANGGGWGAKTGLYAIPVDYAPHKDSDIVITDNSMRCQRRDKKHSTIQGTHVTFDTGKTQTLNPSHVPMCFEKIYAIPVEFDGDIPIKAVSSADGKTYPVYRVTNGKITIKAKEYDIKLPDGYYIIRKLTVTECCRLQGMPDWWFDDVEGNKLISNAQIYKGLGNGWQKDTVQHIMSYLPVDKNEKIVLLSLYDGIGTARKILEDLGYKNVLYIAYEIDKYCITVTSYRYPDVIHMGDCFDIRNDDWSEKIRKICDEHGFILPK